MNPDPNNTAWVLLVAAIIAYAFAYWIPSIIAFARGHSQRWYLLIFNAIAGVTVIGWFVALIWSLGKIGKE